MRNSLTILGAAAIMALGLYLGLRGRSAPLAPSDQAVRPQRAVSGGSRTSDAAGTAAGEGQPPKTQALTPFPASTPLGSSDAQAAAVKVSGRNPEDVQTKIHRGVNITVVDVRRSTEFRFSNGSVVEMGEPGKDFAIVEFLVHSSKRLDLSPLLLLDAQGRKHAYFLNVDCRTAADGMTCSAIFDVPKTAQIESVQIGTVSFDLQHFRPELR